MTTSMNIRIHAKYRVYTENHAGLKSEYRSNTLEFKQTQIRNICIGVNYSVKENSFKKEVKEEEVKQEEKKKQKV